jgi:hypothetical protein
MEKIPPTKGLFYSTPDVQHTKLASKVAIQDRPSPEGWSWDATTSLEILFGLLMLN